ncbi:MAG: carboxypeptidase-like regulatory domain-containing protein [Bacteroidia bacterium]|nr:carboxypeptidase-like regulatory domain-containing protein [Bacteroidia bacterium]
MNLIKHSITIVLLHWVNLVYSQTVTIIGHISDKQGNNLFAVNAYLLKQSTVGTVSDINGNFILKIPNPKIIKDEYLGVSFIGYEPQKIAFDSINYSLPINVIMTENMQALNEIVVEGRKSISREFSIKEMDKLKIYLSPLASGDPLKAIAMLPSSTNTSETANPELRGSNANRTKVFLNGVPVSNPVRNSQINGIGFFSLFNPELIKSMFVYPSNPPLIYGNTSAGMIDIETEDKLDRNNYQISASLATAGICVSQKINEKSFFQLYGNLMFSKGFLFVNPDINKKLKSFNSNDIGLNYHCEISENMTLNFYNYFVSESSNVLLSLSTWQDNFKAKTLRDFSVMNIKYHKSKNYISFNAGTNFSSSRFSFGNINSVGKQQQTYLSLNFKYLFSEKLNIQTGLSNEYGNFRFNDEVPVFYYAISPASPSYQADTLLKNNLSEAYVYFRWKPFNRIIWGMGLRKNVNLLQKNNPDYLSLQTNLKYNFMNSHSLLLSVGKYNNLTEPNYSQEEFRLLSANQIAIEYLFETKKTNINLAAYYKSETGDTMGIRKLKGFEIYIEHYISRTLKASISNTILNSEIGSQGRVYNADNNVGYFLVTTLSYFNPRLFNVSIAWSNRKGKLYTPVSSVIYNPNVDFYEPIYSDNLNSKRFGNYNTINLSSNKMYTIGKSNLIVFISVFNLLDTKNPNNIIYNKDYSVGAFDFYQKRSVYFGCVLSFK